MPSGPATIASSAKVGAHSIQVHCNACHHRIYLGLDGLPGDLGIPSVPRRLGLRCRCGSRDVGVMMDMHAHYARCSGAAHSGMPEDYRVIPWRELVGPKRAARALGGASGA